MLDIQQRAEQAAARSQTAREEWVAAWLAETGGDGDAAVSCSAEAALVDGWHRASAERCHRFVQSLPSYSLV